MLRLIVRLVLALTWLCEARALPLTASDPSLLDISISELGSLLEQGLITSYDLVNLYLKRIEEVNDELRAVIETNPDALAIAKELDAERQAGLSRGPLHGIPIIVKDNYATADSMSTGAGSVCLEASRPKQDATTVAKLRRAGAVVLGKANLSEFSGLRGPNVTAGWSARGGQTYGAYVRHQSACGSSSGSGVVAALGLAAGALGTETSGSITCPAMMNNIVGIKPTMGLTSRFGIVPIILQQDTAGPLAQSVTDAAMILDAIAGQDDKDNYTLAQPWEHPPSYVAALNASALQGKRIGVAWVELETLNGPFYANLNHSRKVFDRALLDLQAAGAELVPIDFDHEKMNLTEYQSEIMSALLVYEYPNIKQAFTRYLDNTVSGVRSTSELHACLRAQPAELASKFSLDSWEQLEIENRTAGSAEMWEAYLKASSMARDVIVKPIQAHNLDAIVMQPFLAAGVTAPPGLPIVTVPMGALGEDAQVVWDARHESLWSAPGLPQGLSFTADRWTEHDLVAYAYAYEQASLNRRKLKPYTQPKADLYEILRNRIEL